MVTVVATNTPSTSLPHLHRQQHLTQPTSLIHSNLPISDKPRQTHWGNILYLEWVVQLQLCVQVLLRPSRQKQRWLGRYLTDIVVPSRWKHTWKKRIFFSQNHNEKKLGPTLSSNSTGHVTPIALHTTAPLPPSLVIIYAALPIV